ncbi:hypothetical protein AMECASPLE_002895 [Ameca splendens]|uniref:Uncharacterized protein n=1 Tax=Ameca splendens TaxID=208324 RepID=A0ABV0ZX78_9TELE
MTEIPWEAARDQIAKCASSSHDPVRLQSWYEGLCCPLHSAPLRQHYLKPVFTVITTASLLRHNSTSAAHFETKSFVQALQIGSGLLRSGGEHLLTITLTTCKYYWN